MNIGALIALLKLAKDSGLTPKAERPSFFGRDKKRDTDFVSIVVRPIYDVTTGLKRAEEGLGL